jgi:hypothetical protein
MWLPGWAKWGGTSSDNLAVSRPKTKAPAPSSTAQPSSSLAAAGAQQGPYTTGRSGYSSDNSYPGQPTGWQADSPQAVAPAGGYSTGGQYGMASTSPQAGVTPGAYAAPGGAAGEGYRTADRRGDAYPPAGTNGGPHDGHAAGGAPPFGTPLENPYVGPQPYEGSRYSPQAPAYGGVPPSTAPGASHDSGSAGAATDAGSVYGNPDASDYQSDMANPALAEPAGSPAGSSSSTIPEASPSATSPAPTTSPAATPFSPPTLPSSLTAAPGSYRPGSTASPGTRYGVQSAIYDQPSTAGGTGYGTPSGTLMR